MMRDCPPPAGKDQVQPPDQPQVPGGRQPQHRLLQLHRRETGHQGHERAAETGQGGLEENILFLQIHFFRRSKMKELSIKNKNSIKMFTLSCILVRNGSGFQ